VFIRFVVRLLGYPLKMLHQPKVISEILAGIVLGPTVLGAWKEGDWASLCLVFFGRKV
jgi:Kef-type K+ transport system membrane component KefB